MSTLAGAAMVDISPRDLRSGRIWMSGYMPRRFATSQADKITARAVGLGDSANGFLIVAVDTCLISPLTASRWAKEIARKVPLPQERIFVITTHTHSGPDFSGLFGGVPPAYYISARMGIVEAARRAWAARKNATLHVGVAQHNIGLPRRRKHGDTDIDKNVLVLQWRGESGVIASLINLGCHGVVYQAGSRVLSSDLPGALCRAADAEYGGVSLFAPRIQGDVNPNIPGENTYQQKGNVKELERLTGEGLESIKKAVSSAHGVAAARYEIESKSFTTNSNNLTKVLFTAPFWTGRLPDLRGTATIDCKKFSIGYVEGFAIPGEVLTCLGEKLLNKLSSPSLLFSYCGGYMGYLMTNDIFCKGGYEPGVSPGPINPDQ